MFPTDCFYPATRKVLNTLAISVITVMLAGPPARAESFRLPDAGDDLIGALRHTKAHQEDTLIDIARRFSVGQDEMVMANPTVDRWLPKEGTDVLIPQEYILPDAPRAGIVVNIPEMRMFYFPVRVSAAAPRKPAAPAAATGSKAPAKAGAAPVTARPAVSPATRVESAGSGEVITYPVSMGRMDWRTPIGKTSVVNKQKDPSWTPPASIKREHAAKGDPLPDVVPPGPDNPLGKYAMRLGVAGYLIHGTDAAKADGIGMRVTHGCMRMYNEDIAKLFPLIPVGTPVYLVNQPVKLGWRAGRLYMEVSQPLDEDVGISPHDVDDDISKEQMAREDDQRARYLLRIANSEIQKQKDKSGVTVSMDRVHKAVEKPTGIPVVIGGTGSAWEQSGDSDVGFAPVAAESDPNVGAVPVRPSLPPASTRIGSAVAGSRVVTRPYDAIPPASASDSSAAGYSPANPYRPPAAPSGPSAEPASDARPAGARSSPYPDPEIAPVSEPPVDPEVAEEE